MGSVTDVCTANGEYMRICVVREKKQIQNQTTRLSPQLIVTICDNGLEPRGSAEPRELTIGVCRDHPRPNRQNDLVHSVSDQQVLPEGREARFGREDSVGGCSKGE